MNIIKSSENEKKTYHFDFTLADTKEHKVLPKNTEVEKKVLGYLVKHQNDFDVYYKYPKTKENVL